MAFESEILSPSLEVAALNARLRDASPQAVLATALESFHGRIAMVSSFGAESAVLLHMAASIDPGLPILFLDTGHLFGQTLDYRKSLAETLGLSDVRDLRPAFRDIALEDPKSDLWKRDTDSCCRIRKVTPLATALEGFDAWITGRKRFHGAAREHLPVVEETDGKVKFNPLASWGKAELDAYAELHALPAHPLVQFGYPSLGCWPCTKPVEAGADVRSGRWAGSAKTECGIHTPGVTGDAVPQDVGRRNLGKASAMTGLRELGKRTGRGPAYPGPRQTNSSYSGLTRVPGARLQGACGAQAPDHGWLGPRVKPEEDGGRGRAGSRRDLPVGQTNAEPFQL